MHYPTLFQTFGTTAGSIHDVPVFAQILYLRPPRNERHLATLEGAIFLRQVGVSLRSAAAVRLVVGNLQG